MTLIDSVEIPDIFCASPECLFQIDFNRKNSWHWIETFPIKGTIKGEGKNEWKMLKSSKKDQAELFMIADLMRNDLSRFSNLPSHVLSRKERLKAPGLTHQFSHLGSYFREKNLWDLMESLFPGGSITGAPKKTVMHIIDKLESWNRGFYCGSTILWRAEHLASSINIRTACYNKRTQNLLYGAGGGLGLLSHLDSEYDEMMHKAQSFFTNLTKSSSK